MITKQKVQDQFPDVSINELPVPEWELLAESMFCDDWDTIRAIMEPRQDLAK